MKTTARAVVAAREDKNPHTTRSDPGSELRLEREKEKENCKDNRRGEQKKERKKVFWSPIILLATYFVLWFASYVPVCYMITAQIPVACAYANYRNKTEFELRTGSNQ